MKTKSKKLIYFIVGVLFLCALAVGLIVRYADRRAAISGALSAPTLVIDAGHGGIDGGAISADGTKESDINLQIALKLESIVRFCGQKTAMTRWDDSKKTDILSYSEHDDLKFRADFANNAENPVFISIHQNYYPTAQPKGAQVLYSRFRGSEELGKLIQSNLVSQLDPDNRRLAVPAPGELYLTANTRCPAVILECGFMSNNFEVLKLTDGAYQNALAVLIAGSYLSYISKSSQV